jgi:hypothetical protein
VAASHWDALGIAATTDRAVIRRAYAERLKAMGPDRDAAAFQRLRTAYETALRDAEERAEPPVEPKPGGFRSEPEPDPAGDHARAAIAAALERDDAAATFAAFDVADQRGLLALADLDAIEEQLLAVTAADRGLSPEQLLRIVRRFQWDNSIHPLRRRRPQAFAALDARLDAERWYRELIERAHRRRGLYESDERLAARQLLSGPPGWWRRHVFPNRSPSLARDLVAFGRHGGWVGDRFDARRVAWCYGRKANRKAQRVFLMVAVALGLFGMLVTAQAPSGLLHFVGGVMIWLFIYLLFHKRSVKRR